MSEDEPRGSKSAGSVLLIDDDESLASAVCDVLRSRGFEATYRDDGAEGLEAALSLNVDVVVTDLRMPKIGGMEVVERLADQRPRLPVILMTAYSSTERTIEATRRGAFDYLAKPFEMPELLEVVGRAVATHRLAAKRVSLGDLDPARDSLIGESPEMREVFKAIGRVADKPVAVLIRGETGTGKELVARAIHQHSQRANKPYVAVNCAAIPDNLIESELFGHERGAFTGATATRVGRFEQAHGGTLFLDEIGDLPAQTQVKLLRVLQEKSIYRVGGREEIKIDVRVLSATHRDLEALMRENEFREDLFYRLNTTAISLPPLRERPQDLPRLIHFLLAKHAAIFGEEPPPVHQDALNLLARQPWPGNVRQMENVIKRALIAGSGVGITLEIVEEALRQSLSVEDSRPAQGGERTMPDLVAARLEEALRGEHPDGAWETLVVDLEREAYRQAVERCHGNQSRMARLLGVSRITVRDKLDKYQLFPKRGDQ